MGMDKRYDDIKFMIENGRITEFRQIFDSFPKSLMGKHLHTNNPRITRLKEGSVGELTVEEIVIISKVFKVDYMKIVEIVFKQYFNNNKNKISE
jgi:hypothetical protein